jgi:hypothetical protein
MTSMPSHLMGMKVFGVLDLATEMEGCRCKDHLSTRMWMVVAPYRTFCSAVQDCRFPGKLV